MGNKTFCDICGKNVNIYAGRGTFMHRRTMPAVTTSMDKTQRFFEIDLCEEHGESVLKYINSLSETKIEEKSL